MSLSQELEHFFQIVKEKYNINSALLEETNSGKESTKPWLLPETYIDGIQDELREVQEEMKENNSVYLEDELGDIFWDYLNLLYCLEEKWLIKKEQVFRRCENKFSERTKGLGEWLSWEEIKSKQKERLLAEHTKLYGN